MEVFLERLAEFCFYATKNNYVRKEKCALLTPEHNRFIIPWSSLEAFGGIELKAE